MSKHHGNHYDNGNDIPIMKDTLGTLLSFFALQSMLMVEDNQVDTISTTFGRQLHYSHLNNNHSVNDGRYNLWQCRMISQNVDSQLYVESRGNKKRKP